MTPLEFDLLSEPEQINVLRAHGTFLAERNVGGNRFYLYSVSSFYVELFHDLASSKDGQIKLLGAFTDSQRLEVYLTNVDITSLYN